MAIEVDNSGTKPAVGQSVRQRAALTDSNKDDPVTVAVNCHEAVYIPALRKQMTAYGDAMVMATQPDRRPGLKEVLDSQINRVIEKQRKGGNTVGKADGGFGGENAVAMQLIGRWYFMAHASALHDLQAAYAEFMFGRTSSVAVANFHSAGTLADRFGDGTTRACAAAAKWREYGVTMLPDPPRHDVPYCPAWPAAGAGQTKEPATASPVAPLPSVDVQGAVLQDNASSGSELRDAFDTYGGSMGGGGVGNRLSGAAMEVLK